MNLNQHEFNEPFIDATYDEALANKITKLASQISAATYQLLEYIAEFDHREGWGEQVQKARARSFLYL